MEILRRVKLELLRSLALVNFLTLKIVLFGMSKMFKIGSKGGREKGRVKTPYLFPSLLTDHNVSPCCPVTRPPPVWSDECFPPAAPLIAPFLLLPTSTTCWLLLLLLILPPRYDAHPKAPTNERRTVTFLHQAVSHQAPHQVQESPPPALSAKLS